MQIRHLAPLGLALAVHPRAAVPLPTPSHGLVHQRVTMTALEPVQTKPPAAELDAATASKEEELDNIAQLMRLALPTGISAVVCLLVTALLAPLSSPFAQGLKLIFAGAVAGIISRTACAPLEMISTVVMCGRGDGSGMVTALRTVWREEGLKGLFKGNGANCLKVAPSRGTQFLVYENVKSIMVAASLSLTPFARLVAAGIAGMVAAALVYPLDVIKTLLTLYPDDCKGIGGAFNRVMKSSGVAGLYRGLGPTLLAMFPYVGVEFMVYETLKGVYETFIGAKAGVIALLALGAVSGAASQLSAHPLDVVRRRLQMQGMRKREGDDTKPPFNNMFDGLYHIGSTEGISALYKGSAAACLEKVPSTAIGYYVYEGMKSCLRVVSL